MTPFSVRLTAENSFNVSFLHQLVTKSLSKIANVFLSFVYCYAVQQREKALRRYKAHDPTSEFLFPPDDFVQNVENGSSLISTPKRQKISSTDLVQGELFS